MARLRRGTAHAIVSEDASLRLRAAWLYYAHGLTQKAVSDRLGLSRGTVIRLLGTALERGEVQISISEGDRDCVELALALEDALGLDEAIVVPDAPERGLTYRSVGLALGKFLSEAVVDGMTIGVGWGRTLTASLASTRPIRRDGVRIVSLLGGIVEARDSNPLEYAWRMAGQFGGDCYLFVAPAFADSVATKRRLIDHCGLDRIYSLASSLDLAVITVGDINQASTSLAANIVGEKAMAELIALGSIADVLCNFLDAEGRSVPHPLNKRVMSIGLEDLRRARHIVIATGGAHRAVAIGAAIKRVGCNTLVTDESAARALLAGRRRLPSRGRTEA